MSPTERRTMSYPEHDGAGRNAPDIVMWTLEATRDGQLVLRRPNVPSVRA